MSGTLNHDKGVGMENLAVGLYVYDKGRFESIHVAANHNEAHLVNPDVPLSTTSNDEIERIIDALGMVVRTLSCSRRDEWVATWFDGKMEHCENSLVYLMDGNEEHQSLVRYEAGLYVANMDSCNGIDDAARSSTLRRIGTGSELSLDTVAGLEQAIAKVKAMLEMEDQGETDWTIMFWYDGHSELCLNDLQEKLERLKSDSN